MIEPGKEPEIRQLENGMLKVAKFLPNLGLAALRLVGRILKGVYNGLLGRTAVKPESKEIANQKNKKEHLLVRAAVGITKAIGVVAKGLSYVARGSYNTVQKLRGKELEKIKNEPSLSREGSFKKENSTKRGNLERSNSLPNQKNSAKRGNLERSNSLPNQKNSAKRGNLERSNSLPNQKNSAKRGNLTRSNSLPSQKDLAKAALKKSVSFTENQRKFSDIKTYGRRKAARINTMKRNQEARNPQRTQPAHSLGG